MKFSIVVAAYNVASYIGQCLESLINQTYRNFEVIVINDASTDNTLDEIYHAIGDDSRFSVVTMPMIPPRISLISAEMLFLRRRRMLLTQMSLNRGSTGISVHCLEMK